MAGRAKENLPRGIFKNPYISIFQCNYRIYIYIRIYTHCNWLKTPRFSCFLSLDKDVKQHNLAYPMDIKWESNGNLTECNWNISWDITNLPSFFYGHTFFFLILWVFFWPQRWVNHYSGHPRGIPFWMLQLEAWNIVFFYRWAREQHFP